MYPPLASRDTHDQFSIKTLLSNKNRAEARALGDAETRARPKRPCYAPDPKGNVRGVTVDVSCLFWASSNQKNMWPEQFEERKR